MILAHKPAPARRGGREVGGAAKAVVVSILARDAAGRRARRATRARRSFCVEPNTPVEVRQGVLAFAEPDVEVDEALYGAAGSASRRVGTSSRCPSG